MFKVLEMVIRVDRIPSGREKINFSRTVLVHPSRIPGRVRTRNQAEKDRGE